MRLYLHMMMCGSVCTLLYIALKHVGGYELKPRCKKIFLVGNMILYLAPLPLLASETKGRIKVILVKNGINLGKKQFFENPTGSHGILENAVVQNLYTGTVYIPGFEKWFPVLLTISCIFLILLGAGAVWYGVTLRKYKHGVTWLKEHPFMETIKKQNQNAKLGISGRISSPVTVGIRRPVILFPENGRVYEKAVSGIVRHELRHIANRDILCSIVTFVIIAVWWYNPLAYYLFCENKLVSELLCDEAAVEGMTKEEKAAYMKCILASVAEAKERDAFVAGLGRTKRITKERMKRIMMKNEKKTWKKKAAIMLVAGSFVVAGLPALAYSEPKVYTETAFSEHVSGEWNGLDMMELALEDIEAAAEAEEFGEGDAVFISETGEVYHCSMEEFQSQKQEKYNCPHDYVDGYLKLHFSKDDGSCRIDTHYAKVCTICENGLIGELKYSTTYPKCTHK